MSPSPPSNAQLQALDPREDLDALRDGLLARVGAGLNCTPALADLAGRDPLALAELLVGPRADGRLVPLALDVAATLEAALSPPALYRRLVDLASRVEDYDAQPVLDHIVRHHAESSWVLPLAMRIEGRRAGLSHLMALSGHPRFGSACYAYARAGARDGLAEVAVGLLRPEPIAALAAVGDVDALIEAVVIVVRAHPAAPVVPWLAACWGPRPDPLVAAVAARVDAATARALLALCSRP